MTDFLSTEVILTRAIVGTSLLATIMGFLMTRKPIDDRPKVDIDALVQNAPYHLLESIGIKVESTGANH